MKNLPYIFTSVAIVLAALFAILNRFWTGFEYFVLGCLLVLSLFWGVWLIYKYFTDFKEELKEKFDFFRANKINSGVVDATTFDANLESYKKEFKKHVLKDKIVKWLIIVVCFAMAITFLTSMFLY